MPQYDTFVPKPMKFLSQESNLPPTSSSKPVKKKKTIFPKHTPLTSTEHPRKRRKDETLLARTQEVPDGDDGDEGDGGDDSDEGETNPGFDDNGDGMELAGMRLVDIMSKKRKDRSRGGRPKIGLLDELLQQCYREGEPMRLLYWCIGAGCTYVWASRGLARTLRHSCSCYKLPAELRKKAKVLAASNSLLTKEETNPATPTIQETTGVPDAPPTINPIQSASIVPFVEKAKKQARKDYHSQLDLAAIKLICGAGLPTSIVGSDDWKDFWMTVDPTYKPANRENLEVKQIISEVEAIREQQLDFLRTQRNLTISCDGGTSRGREAFWTVHVSTEEGRVYFVDGREATSESHTGQWIADLMTQVCR